MKRALPEGPSHVFCSSVCMRKPLKIFKSPAPFFWIYFFKNFTPNPRKIKLTYRDQQCTRIIYAYTVKTPIRNITRSAAKVFRIGGLFRIGGSIFWSKNIMNLNRYKTSGGSVLDDYLVNLWRHIFAII